MEKKAKYGTVIIIVMFVLLTFCHNIYAYDLHNIDIETVETTEESESFPPPVPCHDDGNNDGCG